MGKYKREPLGVRNHNPGCIRGKGGKGYAHYASDEEGYYALINLLKKRYTNKTAYQIFTVYAPASDGNNPKKYANDVIKLLQRQGLKVTGSTKLNFTRFLFSHQPYRMRQRNRFPRTGQSFGQT